MEKRTCPYCSKQIDVQQTENKTELKFVMHTRWKPHSEEESEERVHLRNIVDTLCEGSGRMSNNFPLKNSFFSGHGG